jgi:hypothetical protein
MIGMEAPEGTSDIIFSVRDVSVDVELERCDPLEPAIPGAWDPAFDLTRMEKPLEVEPWAHVSILIGPLKDNIQEFSVRHQGLEE